MDRVPNITTCLFDWSEMTLNYRMMMKRYPNLKKEVGGSNLGREISSLLAGKLARWSTASIVLVLACWPPPKKKKKKKKGLFDCSRGYFDPKHHLTHQ